MTRPRTVVRAMSSLVLACLAAGCNLVLGVGDYAADLPDGKAGGAGTATGGSAGATGGTSGAAGLAGTGGGAGASAGGAGAGGGAGGATCGKGVTLDPDTVRACVLTIGCSPFLNDDRLGDCIANGFPQSVFPYKDGCLAAVQTCSDVQACTGQMVTPASVCGGKTGQAVCSGTKVVSCFTDGTAAVYRDCAKGGGTCGTYMSGGKPTAGCVVKPTCTETDTQSHCDGSKNALYTCVGGVGYGVNCSTVQAKCQGTGASTNCYYTYPTCTATGATQLACDGTALTACTTGGQQIRYKCGSGTACGGTGQALDCLAPGCSYAESVACVESCSGVVANVCIGGATMPIDCSAYGLKGCAVAKIGAKNDIPSAICY